MARGMAGGLYERLRKWRLNAAKTRATGPVPAFCVFSNKMLDALVANPPQSTADLLRHQGFGQSKVAEYGPGILAICRGHGVARGASDHSAHTPSASSSSSSYRCPVFSEQHPSTASPLKRSRYGHASTSVASEILQQQHRAFKHSMHGSNAAHILASSLTPSQRRIAQDVLVSRKNIFLTGPAGTGKSFLFRYIKQQLQQIFPGGVAVTAPTGVAAVNVGGQTIHSWAGVGLGRGPGHKIVAKVMKSAKASARWRSAKVLLIDEISMLDNELFEKLSLVGAAVRGSPIPFGGLQLVLCGDFFQLPPVGMGRKSFAFKAPAWKSAGLLTRELTEVIRQRSDKPFISILNEIRRGHASASALRMLADCHVSRKARPVDGICATRLFCKNSSVDEENEARLTALEGSARVYESHDLFKGMAQNNVAARAKVAASANTKVPSTLTLKVGAQVVLLRNIDPEAKLVNGSRGIVVKFEESRTEAGKGVYGHVCCPGVMCPVVKFDCGTTRRIEFFESWVGAGTFGSVSRVQLPLKLAWALTVHKAQGMTLSRVELEVGDAFDHGQVYVALSRAQSRQGLWISGTISAHAITAHPDVKTFYDGVGRRTHHTVLQRDAKPTHSSHCPIIDLT